MKDFFFFSSISCFFQFIIRMLREWDSPMSNKPSSTRCNFSKKKLHFVKFPVMEVPSKVKIATWKTETFSQQHCSPSYILQEIDPLTAQSSFHSPIFLPFPTVNTMILTKFLPKLAICFQTSYIAFTGLGAQIPCSNTILLSNTCPFSAHSTAKRYLLPTINTFNRKIFYPSLQQHYKS